MSAVDSPASSPTGVRAWLRRAWVWILAALALAVPWVWAVLERRGRLRERARADHAEGALERDATLSAEVEAIERRADGARTAVVTATEREAAPQDAAAQVSAELAAEVASTPAVSRELLEEIARRNSARIAAIRRAAQEPNPW